MRVAVRHARRRPFEIRVVESSPPLLRSDGTVPFGDVDAGRLAHRLQIRMHENFLDRSQSADDEGRITVAAARIRRLVRALACASFDRFDAEEASLITNEDDDFGLLEGVLRLFIEELAVARFDAEEALRGSEAARTEVERRLRIIEQQRLTMDDLERRVAERTADLVEAQENLVRQERLAVLGQLAGGVAHQIRNPLGAILNATFVLRRHVCPHEHPNVQDAIAIIHDEVRQANAIITGLLDYARVRLPDRSPSSVVDIVERALASAWIAPNVRVERDLPRNEDVVLVIDASQLQGAVANLLSNALDAMPDGGTLRVEVGGDATWVVIAVSDTGPGISPSVRAHLFEPLRSTKASGIGLGLVTARRFIEAHHGRLVCADAVAGARFEIHLPR